MKKYLAFATFIAAAASPTLALAYVGPGAGLSLFGALGALLAAVGAALFFVVAWPVRKMLRQRAAKKPQAAAGTNEATHHGTAGSQRG